MLFNTDIVNFVENRCGRKHSFVNFCSLTVAEGWWSGAESLI